MYGGAAEYEHILDKQRSSTMLIGFNFFHFKSKNKGFMKMLLQFIHNYYYPLWCGVVHVRTAYRVLGCSLTWLACPA